MKVFYLEEVADFIENLNIKDHTRVQRVRSLFEEYGFAVGPKYIKKVSRSLWELRAGRIRLFMGIRGNKAFGLHIIYKKTQKISSKDIELAERRNAQI